MTRMRFTLVELLVVIAIIALLAAMLLPALNQAKGRGKMMACASNLKQIGVAALGYASENRELLMTQDWNSASPEKGGDPGWTHVLYLGKWITNGAVFSCPSLPPPAKPFFSPYNPQYAKVTYGVRLDLNTGVPKAYIWRSGSGWAQTYLNFNVFSRPTQFAFAADSYVNVNAATLYAGGQYHQYYALPPMTTSAATHARHHGSMNFLHMDGHAATVKPKDYQQAFANEAGRTDKVSYYTNDGTLINAL